MQSCCWWDGEWEERGGRGKGTCEAVVFCLCSELHEVLVVGSLHRVVELPVLWGAMRSRERRRGVHVMGSGHRDP